MQIPDIDIIACVYAESVLKVFKHFNSLRVYE